MKELSINRQESPYWLLATLSFSYWECAVTMDTNNFCCTGKASLLRKHSKYWQLVNVHALHKNYTVSESAVNYVYFLVPYGFS